MFQSHKSITIVEVSIYCLLIYCVTSEDVDHKKFVVYWNSPTFQCAPHKIFFNDVLDQFNITHNDDGEFRGNQIAILYDPGLFPALLKQADSKNFFFRNGGVPQNGNLSLHLDSFAKNVEELIPNKDFEGIGIIDFESWRPIFRQNFGTLQPYKDISKDFERQRHPWWPNSFIEAEAARNFEKSGRVFMEQTLRLAKLLRPKASWGYYAYPYCFNMNAQKQRDCSSEVKKENDKIYWLFEQSDAFYPSVYMAKNTLNAKQKVMLIEGRLSESLRLRKQFSSNGKSPKILPYYWYRYRDVEEYFNADDLFNTLVAVKTNGADGIVLWGKSADVNTKEKCQRLKSYVQNILGPAVKSIL